MLSTIFRSDIGPLSFLHLKKNLFASKSSKNYKGLLP